MNDAAASSTVTHAALSAERVRLDGARVTYDTLRERYELARLARERQRVVMASHEQTLTALQHLVADVRAALAEEETVLQASQQIPDTVVAAVGLVLAAPRTNRTAERLRNVLACYAEAIEDKQVHPAADQVPSVSSSQDGSSSIVRGRCEQDNGNGLCPLLKWSTSGLSYAARILPERRLLASELARVRCAVALRCTRSANLSTSIDAKRPAASGMVRPTQRETLEDARASLKRVKDLQRCLKRRLYETHQRLTAGTYPFEAAVELYAQIRRELRTGRVTLLRILCEEESLPLL